MAALAGQKEAHPHLGALRTPLQEVSSRERRRKARVLQMGTDGDIPVLRRPHARPSSHGPLPRKKSIPDLVRELENRALLLLYPPAYRPRGKNQIQFQGEKEEARTAGQTQCSLLDQPWAPWEAAGPLLTSVMSAPHSAAVVRVLGLPTTP